MISRFMDWFAVALAGLIAAAAVYHVAAAILIANWARRQPGAPPATAPLPPVTFFRPVKPNTPALRDKLAALAACARPGDQVLVGVGTAADLAVARAVAGLEVIAVGDANGTAGDPADSSPDPPSPPEPAGQPAAPAIVSPAPNPKVAKLIPLTAHARHDHWIVTDSEVLAEPALFAALRAEWGGCGLLSAGYRFLASRSWPQRLDHAATLGTLWPGWMFSRRPSASGAFIAVRAADIARIGGWQTLAAELAEDHRLAERLAAAGVPVRRSRHLITLDADRLTWAGYFHHQLRVAVTFRTCAPFGWAAAPITHGVAPAILLVALHPGNPAAWTALAGIAVVRVGAAAVAARALGFALPALPLAALAGAVAETFFWLLGWLTGTVRWGNLQLRVDPRGHIRRCRRAGVSR